MLKVMRDNPKLVRSAYGMQVQAAALEKIKGTDWEASLFKLGVIDPLVREFRKKHDELYPPEPEAPVIHIFKKARLPVGITTCSICRCYCIDAGRPATVCLGCEKEGRS